MLKRPVLCGDRISAERLIDSRVTNTAFIPDHLSLFAEMLPVMASETSLSVEMPDVVSVR